LFKNGGAPFELNRCIKVDCDSLYVVRRHLKFIEEFYQGNLLSKRVLLPHDKARPHFAAATVESINHTKYEI